MTSYGPRPAASAGSTASAPKDSTASLESRVADACHDESASCERELHAGDPDPACGAVDEDPLTGRRVRTG